jgi:Putative transmembrane protein (PGPGW)
VQAGVAPDIAKLESLNTFSQGWPPVVFLSMLAAAVEATARDRLVVHLRESDMQETETAHVQMTLRRAALFALGWVLILGGIVGLFLPVVPGAVLILAGFAVLSPQSAWLRRALEKCRERFSVLKHFLGLSPGWIGMWRNRLRCNRTIRVRSSEFENDA